MNWSSDGLGGIEGLILEFWVEYLDGLKGGCV